MTIVIMQGLISEPWSGNHSQGAMYTENDSSMCMPVIYGLDIEAKIINGFVKRDKSVSEYLSVEATGKLLQDKIEINYLEVVE